MRLGNPYHFFKSPIAANLRRAAEFRRAHRAMLRSTALTAEEKRWLARVSLRTTPDDFTYDGSAAVYLAVGFSAVQAIDEALRAAGRSADSVRSIFDFPSGYGRVLRFLRARFPQATITAGEIDETALDFCRRAFSARTVASQPRFDSLADVGPFDLVWCGSLLTHIDRAASAALLAFLRRQLGPRGVCVFTTHGIRTREWIEDGTQRYGLSPAAQGDLLSQFRDSGYGYVDYDGQHGYGISMISRTRMLELAADAGDWSPACYLERGWLDHQDVYAFVAPAS